MVTENQIWTLLLFYFTSFRFDFLAFPFFLAECKTLRIYSLNKINYINSVKLLLISNKNNNERILIRCDYSETDGIGKMKRLKYKQNKVQSFVSIRINNLMYVSFFLSSFFSFRDRNLHVWKWCVFLCCCCSCRLARNIQRAI